MTLTQQAISAFDKLVSKIDGRDSALKSLAAIAATWNQSPEFGQTNGPSLRNVFPWQELGSQSNRMTSYIHNGLHMDSHLESAGSFSVTKTTVLPRIDINIREVQGLGCSKDDICACADLDTFARDYCAALMQSDALALLRKGNVRCWSNGVAPTSKEDNFVFHQWDGRIHFSNCDGSHHFAAARAIAKKIGFEILVGASTTVHELDAVKVAAMRQQYEIFFASKPSVGLYNSLAAMKADWKMLEMPARTREEFFLVLPKSSPRSMQVAGVLRDAGAIDVGRLLSTYLLRAVPAFSKIKLANLVNADSSAERRMKVF